MLAGGHPADSRFPAFLQEVKSRYTQADGNKAQGEQREGRQEFPDKVKLERGDTPKKPPDPLAKTVFGFHDFGSLSPDRQPGRAGFLTSFD